MASKAMCSRGQESGGKVGQACSLDAEECLTLLQVLEAFNTAISEEHAWALFYQCSKCFQHCLKENDEKLFRISGPKNIIIHKDGAINRRSLLLAEDEDDRCRESVTSENQLVKSLALVIYNALDYAHGDDEERLISPDLEGLINGMTVDEPTDSCNGYEGSEVTDTDDEGIERDSEPTTRRFTLTDVIERCAWHCGDRDDSGGAAAHYRAVCRALIAEALELSSFLARVKAGGARDLGAAHDNCFELDNLRFADWARFWMQVIGELRMGVKLKKVNFSRTPIEYEMTPYEILMDDIRSRRYKLKKVDGAIPQRVKKDAHAMILEFIRSRPPLKKASERQLAPLDRAATPREKLLESIQQGRPLRHIERTQRRPTVVTLPTPPIPVRRLPGKSTPSAAQPQRRLIKVDFDNLDDDEEEFDPEPCGPSEISSSAPQAFPRSYRSSLPIDHASMPQPWKRTALSPPRVPPRTRVTHDEYHQFCDTALESYDLATQCPSRRASMRRHTVVASANNSCDGSQSVPQSRPASRQSGGLSACSSELDAPLASLGVGDISWSRSSLQDEFVKSKQFQDALLTDDRLSLTLEEIVHIRSVLTKAELEVLPVEGKVKEDVEKRRVCFLCLKTRFGIFGPWGQTCRLCKKTVCQKCHSKMRIPTEHFSNVPVVLLSPSLVPSPDEDHGSFPRSLMARLVPDTNQDRAETNSVGSAPASPRSTRNAQSAPPSRLATCAPGDSGPRSMPSPSFAPGRGYSVTASERLRGTAMTVCHDCKSLVLQIIKSSRATRTATRNHALKNLTLNLSPVYTSQC